MRCSRRTVIKFNDRQFATCARAKVPDVADSNLNKPLFDARSAFYLCSISVPAKTCLRQIRNWQLSRRHNDCGRKMWSCHNAARSNTDLYKVLCLFVLFQPNTPFCIKLIVLGPNFKTSGILEIFGMKFYRALKPLRHVYLCLVFTKFTFKTL